MSWVLSIEGDTSDEANENGAVQAMRDLVAKLAVHTPVDKASVKTEHQDTVDLLGE